VWRTNPLICGPIGELVGPDRQRPTYLQFTKDRSLCGTNDNPSYARQIVGDAVVTAMSRPARLTRWLIVAALAAVLFTACASLVQGPLGPTENDSTACVPAAGVGQALTIGIDSAKNTGGTTLVIDRIALASPRHIRLTGAYVVPGENLVGEEATFPPPASEIPANVQWSRRHKPAGARLSPGQWSGFVVGLAPVSRATASTAGLVVFYHVGSAQYEWRSHVRIVIKVPPMRCF